LADTQILEVARAEGRILLTQDKDFVELVLARKLPHAGVIFFQLGNSTLPDWIARVETVLAGYSDDLSQQRFLTVTPYDVTVSS
jgi:predicted nuclease of predicted toxin-antitoxin system